MKNAVLAVLLAVGMLCLSAVISVPPPRRARAQGVDVGPIILTNSWNVGSVVSGGAVLATDLKTKYAGSEIRIAVVLGSSATLAIRETDGTYTFTSPLNSGTALTAGCCYGFTWAATNTTSVLGNPGAKAITFNFVVQGGASTVPVLRVVELPGTAN